MDELSHQLSFADLFRLSLRVFKTKPMRTVLTIAGMSVGIGTVVFLVSMGYGLQFILIGKLVTTEDSLITLEASYPSESGVSISAQKIDEIGKMPESQEISPVAEFPAEIKVNGATGLVISKIVNPNYFRLAGVNPDIGSVFKDGEAGIVISNQAAKLIDLDASAASLNKPVDLIVAFQSEQSQIVNDQAESKQPLAIKGIVVDDTQPPFAYIPAEYLTKDPPAFKSILVKARDIEVIEKLRDVLISQGFLISARVDLVNQAKKVMNIITMVLGVFGVAALIVSAIGMFNTMIVGFLERIYEVGIMKSLGATDRDVKNLFLMESFLMGFLGGAGGVTIGVTMGKAVNFGLSVLAEHLGGKALTLFIAPLWFIGLTLTLSSLIGVISGFWPAQRASYLSPKEAFKNR